jgi:hypothetical protein
MAGGILPRTPVGNQGDEIRALLGDCCAAAFFDPGPLTGVPALGRRRDWHVDGSLLFHVLVATARAHVIGASAAEAV